MISEKRKEQISLYGGLTVIALVGLFVHELGHMMGILLSGAEITRFGITFAYILPSLFVGTYASQLNGFMLFSGGMVQAMFYMIFYKWYPEMKYAAVLAVGYGFLEVLTFL